MFEGCPACNEPMEADASAPVRVLGCDSSAPPFVPSDTGAGNVAPATGSSEDVMSAVAQASHEAGVAAPIEYSPLWSKPDETSMQAAIL